MALQSRVQQPESIRGSPHEAVLYYNPCTGTMYNLPEEAITAHEFRISNGVFAAWLFNPWTGAQRQAYDVGSDMFGHLIVNE